MEKHKGMHMKLRIAWKICSESSCKCYYTSDHSAGVSTRKTKTRRNDICTPYLAFYLYDGMAFSPNTHLVLAASEPGRRAPHEKLILVQLALAMWVQGFPPSAYRTMANVTSDWIPQKGLYWISASRSRDTTCPQIGRSLNLFLPNRHDDSRSN